MGAPGIYRGQAMLTEDQGTEVDRRRGVGGASFRGRVMTLPGSPAHFGPVAIGVMNMILHGIEAPSIIHTNTLAENLSDIQEKDRYDIVMANPPFGGKERKEVQQNFPIRTGETAFLFLQHFIKILRAGLQKTFADSPKSWSVNVKDLDPKTFDLSVKNPDGGEEITHRSPAAIMKEIAELDAESAKVLGNIKKLLK